MARGQVAASKAAHTRTQRKPGRVMAGVWTTIGQPHTAPAMCWNDGAPYARRLIEAVPVLRADATDKQKARDPFLVVGRLANTYRHRRAPWRRQIALTRALDCVDLRGIGPTPIANQNLLFL
ncbi:hypothetical protein MesoLj113c_05470 [Mesorhizobium sp. 113-3-9]|nr:hypothetical protein MesoLj113c_05470 [Mesorhizobium sp. 113-3-9]